MPTGNAHCKNFWIWCQCNELLLSNWRIGSAFDYWENCRKSVRCLLYNNFEQLRKLWRVPFSQFNSESFLLKLTDFQMVYPQSMKISRKILAQILVQILVQIQVQKLKLLVIILVPISIQIPLKLLKMDLFRQKLKLWQWSLAHPFYCFWLNKVSAPKKCCISQFIQFMKNTVRN